MMLPFGKLPFSNILIGKFSLHIFIRLEIVNFVFLYQIGKRCLL